MTNLESNTRARRVEPLVLERWAIVDPRGEIMFHTVRPTKHRAELIIGHPLGDYQVRKVKLTIEVVE